MTLELDVFTLFPGYFDWLRETRPVRNAAEAGSLRLRTIDLRDHALGDYRQVDDAPYGGGAGMVIRVDVVCAALEATYGTDIEAVLRERRVAVLTPVGRQLSEAVVTELAALERLTLLCGRYEGFDQRVHDHLANDELSVGRYVLSGGEVAAMAVIDAVTRKLARSAGQAREPRARLLLRGARRPARVSPLHAARAVPRLAGARGAALGPPRRGRALAPRLVAAARRGPGRVRLVSHAPGG